MNTMGRYFIANWKMNLKDSDVKSFLVRFSKQYKRIHKNDHVVLCPTFTSLITAKKGSLKNKAIAIGAQDVFWEKKGNFTGEVSPTRLKKIGVSYCIVGHSERRTNLGETDTMINNKIKALLEVRITPVLCIGETVKERKTGLKNKKLMMQLRKGLVGITKNKHVIVAYEPLWAISKNGKGNPMTTTVITREMESLEKAIIKLGYKKISLLYGGSVSPLNVKSIMSIPSVNGVLVGNASLSAPSFLKISTTSL
jgi:triosephosphate isomerase (TIM)